MQHILEYHYLSFTGIIDLKTAYLLNVKKNKYAHTQEKKSNSTETGLVFKTGFLIFLDT